MTLFRLAWRNLIGAGTRTWLNVLVLSMSFVVIVWTQGMIEGMNAQARDAATAAEYAGGQYWQAKYDPYDPFTLTDAHGPLPAELAALVSAGDATPVLVVQGAIYSGGSMRPVLLKAPTRPSRSSTCRRASSPRTAPGCPCSSAAGWQLAPGSAKVTSSRSSGATRWVHSTPGMRR